MIGRYNLCDNYGREDLGHHHYGHYSTGAMRRYHNTSIKSVFPIPETMTLEQAALVDASSIALHAVERAGVGAGETAAIIGPWAQGLLAGQLAGLLGAARVIVVGRGDRLKTAQTLGFEVVDNSETDGPEGVRELTANEHYWIREHRQQSGPLELSIRPGPRVLMVTSGRIELGELTVSTGGTALVPAAAMPTLPVVRDEAVVLEIGLTV